MDLVLPPGWEDLGAKGLVVLFVLMIFLGWLIPKRWVDKIIRDKDETIRVQRRTIQDLTTATQDLAVGNYTAAHALHTVAEPAKSGDES